MGGKRIAGLESAQKDLANALRYALNSDIPWLTGLPLF
jgi:hypothetical protein